MNATVKKLDWVDALRGIAVVGVILVHAGQFGLGKAGLPLKFAAFIGDGARGVQLFYMMSAFTLCYTFSLHSQREVYALRNFFTRRFFRIVPLFYIVIAYYFLIDGLGSRYQGGSAAIDLFTVLSTVTFTNGFHPHWINSLVPGGWSIAVEMPFYCMVPFLFARLTSLRSWAVAFAAVLLIKGGIYHQLLQVIVQHPTREWYEFLDFCLPTQLPIFMLGILLYLIICKNALARITAKGWGALGIGAALFIFIDHYGKGNYPFINCLDPQQLGVGAFFFLLSLSLSRLQATGVVTRIFAPIGKLSYSMYLVHYTVLCWLTKLGWLDFFPSHHKFVASINFGARFALVLAITVALSWITYRFIEKPCIALGATLIRKREAMARPAPVAA